MRDLIKIVNDSGYTASIAKANFAASAESLKRTNEITKWKRLFVVSLTLTIPVVIIR